MLAAGGSHSCAIAADDTITCWGANPAGQADPPAGQYKAITAGFHHSCAIAADDTITCWGLNIYGRADAPTGQYKAIAAGGEHSCAIAIDDTITCWGLNDHGRADVPAALSMTPGKGVNVIVGRADWASGYFQAELYKLLLEELGYNVSDPAELEAGVSIAYLAMADSPLPLRKWVYAIYLDCTSLRGISAMSLHRSSGVCYKTAWFLQQRIREAFAAAGPKVPFEGPVEVDETYVGGKAKNMHAKKRRERITGRGGVDKTPVVGARDRATGHVAATVVENVDGPTLRGFVADHTADESTMVYTDGASAYRGRPNHEAVEWAASVGLTTGYDDGMFRPDEPLAKWRALVFMERFYDSVLDADRSADFTSGDMMSLLHEMAEAAPGEEPDGLLGDAYSSVNVPVTSIQDVDLSGAPEFRFQAVSAHSDRDLSKWPVRGWMKLICLNPYDDNAWFVGLAISGDASLPAHYEGLNVSLDGGPARGVASVVHGHPHNNNWRVLAADQFVAWFANGDTLSATTRFQGEGVTFDVSEFRLYRDLLPERCRW